ncbi:MAG: [Clostridia bacterium]|nr:[FeFe] hydrogenase H-cluster radical SAM maturase HydE [Clostridia bacterium]
MKSLIDKLERNSVLSKDEYTFLISGFDNETSEYLFEKARNIREKYYGKDVYIRGLIEFTSYCKNNCLYCGLRCGNKNAQRYRLSKEDILECCKNGYELGFRTFVLQGGEDPYFTDERMLDIISSIKSEYPDCALTLSVGEKSYETYKAFFDAGADRYLLRHETADNEHYAKLHPKEMSALNRKRCLEDLKSIGYQVGCGFMVGSPYQTAENLADDMLYIKKLQPQMVGIGPFISQHDTPFADQKNGTLELTLFMLGLLRLTLPYALIPSTTALGTIHPLGREKGILAGANVVMPNLSPVSVRKKYLLYDNKICTGDESAECRRCLEQRMKSIGYNVVVSRGDCADKK